MNMNMDFKALKERAAAAASEATTAVSQFNSLDAMAEEDAYLKTDDLNVKGQNKKEKWVEDLDEEGDNGGGGGAAGSASAVVSAPNTATKPAAHEMTAPSVPPPSGATQQRVICWRTTSHQWDMNQHIKWQMTQKHPPPLHLRRSARSS